jgi:hypothetical protein
VRIDGVWGARRAHRSNVKRNFSPLKLYYLKYRARLFQGHALVDAVYATSRFQFLEWFYMFPLVGGVHP